MINEEPFIERMFELGDDNVIARFYRPQKSPSGEFQCRWTVTWPNHEIGRYVCGEDGVQALMLAMRLVHSKLRESDAYKLGKLTLFGQSDLDLPPAWEQGPLYDAQQPNSEPPPCGAA